MSDGELIPGGASGGEVEGAPTVNGIVRETSHSFKPHPGMDEGALRRSLRSFKPAFGQDNVAVVGVEGPITATESPLVTQPLSSMEGCATSEHSALSSERLVEHLSPVAAVIAESAVVEGADATDFGHSETLPLETGSKPSKARRVGVAKKRKAASAGAEKPPKATKPQRVKKEVIPEPDIDADVVEAAVELIRDLTGKGLINEIRRGDALEKLYRGARSDKNFARVLKEHRLGIGERQARNLRTVSQRFAATAEQWAMVGATHTHLRFLVDAPDGLVSQLLDEMKGGAKLTTQDFRRRAAEASGVKGDAKACDRVGGLRGLRAMAHRAADDNVGDFTDHLAKILASVEEKLGARADGSPKIVKEHTVKAVSWSTRCALKIFEQTFTGFWPEKYFNGLHSYRRFTAVGDRMHCLRRVLQILDRPPSWPTDGALWIRDEVIPLLRWALGQPGVEDTQIDAIISQGKAHWYRGDLPPTEQERLAGEYDHSNRKASVMETSEAA